MCNKKNAIIGIFVKKNKILSFLEILKYKFKIKLDKIFIYSISNNEKEFLVTFRTFDKGNFIKNLPGSTVLHTKNGCLFSINALNKLIENYYEYDKKIPYNEVEIDWELYKDKLIILTNEKLNINDLSKIENKCCFFN